jgi:hypothetical protein
MDVPAFIAEFRSRTTDNAATYLWSDAFVLGVLNEALDEACERGRLLKDRTTAACSTLTMLTGVSDYPLHPSVIWVERVFDTTRNRTLVETSVEELDGLYYTPRPGAPGTQLLHLSGVSQSWEILQGEPSLYLQEEGSLRLVAKPDALHNSQTLTLTVYRRQLNPRTLATGAYNTAPEIPDRYHLRLMDWMLYRAYSVPDAETLNKVKAAEFFAMFEASFGKRIDANVQRKQRNRKPAVVRFQW